MRIAARRPSRPLAVAAIVAGGLALIPAGPDAQAATAFCAQPVTATKITWVGGHGSSWSTGPNWTGHKAPDASGTAAYQNQYVCIGGKANVTLGKGKVAYVAGIDIGQGATLTVDPGAQLFIGAPPETPTVGSLVESGSTLEVLAASLGGNAPLTVAGNIHLTGKTIGTKREVTIVTGPGALRVRRSGRLFVDGRGFGGVDLTGGRVVNNFGHATFSGNGYVAIDDGGRWINEARSLLAFKGAGGIYQGVVDRRLSRAALVQRGRLRGAGTGIAVIGVPTTFLNAGPVSVTKGGVVVDAPRPPAARLSRNTSWGSGGCQQVGLNLCRVPNASRAERQIAYATTSAEAGAPKRQTIRVAIVAHGPTTIKGHRVLGHQVNVTAPTGHTTHSTHLHFFFDASVKGVHNKPTVWRNGHRITYCAVHGLTARNTSCVVSAAVMQHGPTKGDLEIMVITIQPKAHWLTS